MNQEINIEVTPDFKERVENECKKRGITEAMLITMAVENLLNKQEMEREDGNVEEG